MFSVESKVGVWFIVILQYYNGDRGTTRFSFIN